MFSPLVLRCGTSGWSHSDWDSVVYPRVRPRGFHPLDHVSRHLNAVEIDTSFEQPLRPELARLWLRKVAHNPEFLFTALLGRAFTFDRQLDEETVKRFKSGLWPLLEAGKLGCLLMRFPWAFRFTPENRDLVIELRRRFHEFPLVAEMRHSSWTLDEALGVLMDYRIGFCNVDQPAGARATGPGAIITSSVGYVRLLGQGGGDWTQEDAAADYLYTPIELARWQPRVERLAMHTTRTFVIAANHTGGKAMVNALQLAAMLGNPTSLPQRRNVGAVERAAPPMPPRRQNVIPFSPAQVLRA